MKRGFAIVIAILAVTLGAQQGAAQPSTPEADQCRSPLIVDAPDFPVIASPAPPTPTPLSDGTAPSAAFASPAPEPLVPAPEEVVAGVEALAESLAACISSGDTAVVAELTSAEFRGDLYGGGERLSVEEYVEIVAGGEPVPTRIENLTNVQFDGIRTVGADLTLVRGNQLLLERWTFLFIESRASGGTPVAANEGSWRAHRIQPLGAPDFSPAETLTATLSEYVTDLDADRMEGPELLIAGRNEGVEAHEMLVLRVAPGADVSDLLRSPDGGIPDGIAIVGQLTLLPGESGEIALVDLEPGDYAIVCLLPDAAGVPHLAFGQQATFQITGP